VVGERRRSSARRRRHGPPTGRGRARGQQRQEDEDQDGRAQGREWRWRWPHAVRSCLLIGSREEIDPAPIPLELELGWARNKATRHETRSERERDGAGSSLCLSLSLFLRGSVSGLVWQWQRCVCVQCRTVELIGAFVRGGAGGRDTGSKGPARECEAAMCGGYGIGIGRTGRETRREKKNMRRGRQPTARSYGGVVSQGLVCLVAVHACTSVCLSWLLARPYWRFGTVPPSPLLTCQLN
jgi:hypothetical protein